MLDSLTEDNFILYAAQHYDNPNCHDAVEFYDDLKRFKYLRKLFYRYREFDDLKERLILNHIIVLNNIFGAQAIANMLALKLHDYIAELKPFMVMVDIMPEILEFENTRVVSSDIPMDPYIVEQLRKI